MELSSTAIRQKTATQQQNMQYQLITMLDRRKALWITLLLGLSKMVEEQALEGVPFNKWWHPVKRYHAL